MASGSVVGYYTRPPNSTLSLPFPGMTNTLYTIGPLIKVSERGKTTKDGIWLGRWILHSATQFHPFSTLPWDDQYPLHHRAIDQSLREGKDHQGWHLARSLDITLGHPIPPFLYPSLG